jgi:hypothetical protein
VFWYFRDGECKNVLDSSLTCAITHLEASDENFLGFTYPWTPRRRGGVNVQDGRDNRREQGKRRGKRMEEREEEMEGN